MIEFPCNNYLNEMTQMTSIDLIKNSTNLFSMPTTTILHVPLDILWRNTNDCLIVFLIDKVMNMKM